MGKGGVHFLKVSAYPAGQWLIAHYYSLFTFLLTTFIYNYELIFHCSYRQHQYRYGDHVRTFAGTRGNDPWRQLFYEPRRKRRQPGSGSQTARRQCYFYCQNGQ